MLPVNVSNAAAKMKNHDKLKMSDKLQLCT